MLVYECSAVKVFLFPRVHGNNSCNLSVEIWTYGLWNAFEDDFLIQTVIHSIPRCKDPLARLRSLEYRKSTTLIRLIRRFLGNDLFCYVTSGNINRPSAYDRDTRSCTVYTTTMSDNAYTVPKRRRACVHAKWVSDTFAHPIHHNRLRRYPLGPLIYTSVKNLLEIAR